MDAIVNNFEYRRLLDCLGSPDIVLDDRAWRDLARWRRQLKWIAEDNPEDLTIREEISRLDEWKTLMRTRAESVSFDAVNRTIDDINRVQGAMDVLTRIPEFVAMVENARDIREHAVDDTSSVMENLRVFEERLVANTKKVLTPSVSYAAMAMIHNIRAYMFMFAGAAYDVPGANGIRPLPGLVVLANPMPRKRARELMVALGEWVCGDPDNLYAPRKLLGLTVADLLRILAMISPECFNLLHEHLGASQPADTWIATDTMHPLDMIVALVYLFPRQLFAQNTDIIRVQVAVAQNLYRALEMRTPVRDLLYRIAFAYVHRWMRVRNISVNRDLYRRAMTELWTPELDIPPAYFALAKRAAVPN